MADLKNRFDFIYLFDVQDGNPNGDPDAGNLPRVDSETGFSEEDLQLFFDALKNMFDFDRSAARGLMSAQKLIVFKHDSILGNAPANKLFDLVKIEKNTDAVPRSFNDYKVTIDTDSVPSGVTVEEMI